MRVHQDGDARIEGHHIGVEDINLWSLLSGLPWLSRSRHGQPQGPSLGLDMVFGLVKHRQTAAQSI